MSDSPHLPALLNQEVGALMYHLGEAPHFMLLDVVFTQNGLSGDICR